MAAMDRVPPPPCAPERGSGVPGTAASDRRRRALLSHGKNSPQHLRLDGPATDRCHRVFGQFPGAPLHPSNRWRTDPEHSTLTLDNTTANSSMTVPVPPGVVIEVIIEMPSERGEKDSSA